MLLTITASGPSAGDLGFLLHKHPDRVQRFEVSDGLAYVFYPERRDDRCTAVLLLEVDPVGLVRRRRGREVDGFALAQYVNDRPYAASSMLAVALGRVFRTAMNGRCDARPELPDRPLRLRLRVPAVPCRGGIELVERLFTPLGWSVTAAPVALDPAVPAWGDSRYVDLGLTGVARLADALSQLYVLLPVLDDAKHYWVSPDEIDKLLKAGGRWLPGHPERELITARYLRHRRSLVTTAIARLAEVDDLEPETLDNAVNEEPVVDEADGVDESRVSLARQRQGAVLAVLRAAGATRVVDCGCGDGALLRVLLADRSFTEIVGVDVSSRALEFASRRLRLERLADRQLERIRLLQSSVIYRDARIAGFDALVLMEVVEHIDPARLPAVERAILGHARPATLVVTTPNVEYNVLYPGLAAGAMRHRDHRFEWTRAQFRQWADTAAQRYGYTVRQLPVGDPDPRLGAPTQLAVFTRSNAPRKVEP